MDRNSFTRSGLQAVSAAAICVGMSISPALSQQFTMKLSTVTTNDPNHESIKMYKERIEAATNGQIKAELYPSAQLGGIPRLIEGIQFGTIEWFSTPPGFLKGIDPRFQVIESPGVFDSMRHAHDTITDPAFREPFANAGVSKGVKAISVWSYGGSSYASTTPIRGLDDFKNKKFRVLATKLETTLMSRLGASGVPIDFAQVLPALQRGTVDGVRSNIAVMAGSKYFTVAKFVTVTDDTYIPIVAFVGTAFLKRLPKDLRETVERVGREMEDDIFEVAVKFDKRARELWRENGAEVITLPAKDQQELMSRARQVTQEVIAGDPALADIFKIMAEVAEKHRSN